MKYAFRHPKIGLLGGIALSLIIVLVILGVFSLTDRGKEVIDHVTQEAEEKKEEKFPPPIEEVYIDETNGYSIIFTDKREPTLKHTAPANFRLRNDSGAVLTYDTTSQSFQMKEPGLDAKRLEPYVQADNFDIYLWESGEGSDTTRTYLVVLENDKILQVIFTYEQEEEQETTVVDALKSADSETMKTFSRLY